MAKDQQTEASNELPAKIGNPARRALAANGQSFNDTKADS